MERSQDAADPRGRVWVLPVVSAVILAVLVASGFWLAAHTPQVLTLQPVAESSPPAAPSDRDADAQAVTQRLMAASGRTFESLVEQLPEQVANPIESEAPTVAGAQAASEQYAETLAALAEAEAAAAEQLALTQKELKAAERARSEAAQSLAKEEAAAARQIDSAIANAIAAAQANEAFSVSLGDDFGATATIPKGTKTSPDEVLRYVRKHFPASEVGNAMAIARCESGLANAVGAVNSNGSRDFGVFQINDGGTLQAALGSLDIGYTSITQARKKALNTALNVRMARSIWDSRGWQPWVCAAKMKVVAGLYQSARGPLHGEYNEQGRRK